jgi:dTDP-4-amino-4,6-dideoxygalactose transaminase
MTSATSTNPHQGRSTTTLPFPAWPHFEQDEIEAATNVLRSGKVNYWTGNEGHEFEREFAQFVNCRHAVALANGSVAIELALYALGIGAGDDVLTTSRSFIASASSAVMRGARPVFADVDRDSQNITADTIKAALTTSTKAIIAVHLAGWPCDMDPILAVARERGIKVIEDCAQALGAKYKGRPVGSLGDAAAFSFCQDKILTTGGEGGMLTTNSDETWSRAWSYKDHGKSYDAVYNQQHGSGFRWLHESFGTNWRLTEMQSAIGRAALKKVPGWVETRRTYAQMLTEGFLEIPGIRVALPPPFVEHAYYKYYAFVDPHSLQAGWNRDRIMESVCAEGVPCFSGSCSEMYLEKAFPQSHRPQTRLPTARELGDTSLMFVIHPTLRPEHIEQTIATFKNVMIDAVGHVLRS